MHDAVSDLIDETVRRFDRRMESFLAPESERRSPVFERILGDRRFKVEEEYRRRNLFRIAPKVEFSRFDTFDPGIDFSARIDLPRTQDRIQLFIDNIDREDLPIEAFDRFRPRDDPSRSEDTSAFLRFQAIQEMLFSLDFDVGLRFRPNPVPRARLRATHPWAYEIWYFKVEQSAFWESDEGFGEKSALEIRRILDEHSHLGSDSAALWSESSQGLELGQVFSFYRYFERNQESIGLEGGILAETHPNFRTSSYIARVPFRRQIWRPWFFMRIEPGIDFSRAHDFQANPRILFQIEFHIGGGTRR